MRQRESPDSAHMETKNTIHVHFRRWRRPPRPAASPAAALLEGGLLLLLLLPAGDAVALPRYSARYGQSCSLCHVNPTGGGLRTLYASQYIVPAELSLVRYAQEEPPRFDPSLSDEVFLGIDQRTVLHEGEGRSGGSGSVAMQADVYLGIQADERFTLYAEQGLRGNQEYFGLAYVLPAHGYLKGGRFTLPYGWRFADHQMASRRYLLFPEGTDNTSTLVDSGMELGLAPGPLDVALALHGGGGENGDRYAARAVVRHSLGRLNLAVGGSFLRWPDPAVERRAAGAFGYAALDWISWVWEVDDTRLEGPGAPGGVHGLLISQELAWRLRRGLDLRATYSFQDPDRDLETGTRARYGLGVDSLPYPFLGLQVMGNYYDHEAGQAAEAADYLQAEIVLHFLY